MSSFFLYNKYNSWKTFWSTYFLSP